MVEELAHRSHALQSRQFASSARWVGHGQRVATLYGGGLIACRHCYRSPTPARARTLATAQQGGRTGSERAWGWGAWHLER
jgi:hypothetical protein